MSKNNNNEETSQSNELGEALSENLGMRLLWAMLNRQLGTDPIFDSRADKILKRTLLKLITSPCASSDDGGELDKMAGRLSKDPTVCELALLCAVLVHDPKVTRRELDTIQCRVVDGHLDHYSDGPGGDERYGRLLAIVLGIKRTSAMVLSRAANQDNAALRAIASTHPSADLITISELCLDPVSEISSSARARLSEEDPWSA